MYNKQWPNLLIQICFQWEIKQYYMKASKDFQISVCFLPFFHNVALFYYHRCSFPLNCPYITDEKAMIQCKIMHFLFSTMHFYFLGLFQHDSYFQPHFWLLTKTLTSNRFIWQRKEHLSEQTVSFIFSGGIVSRHRTN